MGFPPLTMTVFVGLAVAALLLDVMTHRNGKPVTLARACMWSVFWVAISLAFAGFLYVRHGAEAASLFVTGYALEKVLSIDNLFVFMAIFAWFKVPDGLRHRVLYWGVVGAIVFRGVFVAIGTGLLSLGPLVEIAFAVIVASSSPANVSTSRTARFRYDVTEPPEMMPSCAISSSCARTSTRG